LCNAARRVLVLGLPGTPPWRRPVPGAEDLVDLSQDRAVIPVGAREISDITLRKGCLTR
jgi:hypothetical protein